MDIYKLLEYGVDKKASDLHLIHSSPPILRINGTLQTINGAEVLNGDDIYQMFCQLTTPDQRSLFSKTMELDFGHNLESGGRTRGNACMQRGFISLACRLLPSEIPTLDELQLPKMCKDLIVKQRGLILVTGPTGSGKSTTLAAMLQYLNTTSNRYIVTIEDPIEYMYKSIQCYFSQRELETDTKSFAAALKHVLRQDPDVILVGEMRDLETASTVLTAAETGHLIISTGHAPSAAQSVERIIDMFPPHERHLAQARLSSVLVGVLCQTLVPRITGGRIAAVEIMLGTPAVKNLIREGKPYLLPNSIRAQTSSGMQSTDDVLVKLYQTGVIEWSAVMTYCQDPEEVNKMVGGVPVCK